jgi:DNA (cytosine-5)-methyltransferase 1
VTAYYNENDKFAAAWLRELIADNLIAPGEVDERSIEDVRPDDLAGFVQCHFFAGIGVWSYAFRRAGIPDDYPLWSVSCPCQPFSAAGQGKGFADERHLRPAFYHIASQLAPEIIFGEQVASKDGYHWLDLVQTDLEAMDYAFGPVVLPSAGCGAPHGRHRIFFVALADAAHVGHERSRASRIRGNGSENGGAACELGNANIARPQGRPGVPERADQWPIGPHGMAGGVADTDLPREYERAPGGEQPLCDERNGRLGALEYTSCQQERISRFARERRATSGYWGNADWVPCRGGKWRAIEPGTFPLAHGAPARMGRLRGYGNAINAEVGAMFVEEAFASIGELLAGKLTA